EDKDAHRNCLDEIDRRVQRGGWLVEVETTLAERDEGDDGQRDQQRVGGDVLHQSGDANAEQSGRCRQSEQRKYPYVGVRTGILQDRPMRVALMGVAGYRAADDVAIRRDDRDDGDEIAKRDDE